MDRINTDIDILNLIPWKLVTDYEQSLELEKILPTDTSDMFYELPTKKLCFKDETYEGMGISAWSLRGLHNFFSTLISSKWTHYQGGSNNGLKEVTAYFDDKAISASADNYVDACYKLAIKLKEEGYLPLID
jgi:hypothetical protein